MLDFLAKWRTAVDYEIQSAEERGISKVISAIKEAAGYKPGDHESDCPCSECFYVRVAESLIPKE